MKFVELLEELSKKIYWKNPQIKIEPKQPVVQVTSSVKNNFHLTKDNIKNRHFYQRYIQRNLPVRLDKKQYESLFMVEKERDFFYKYCKIDGFYWLSPITNAKNWQYREDRPITKFNREEDEKPKQLNYAKLLEDWFTLLDWYQIKEVGIKLINHLKRKEFKVSASLTSEKNSTMTIIDSSELNTILEKINKRLDVDKILQEKISKNIEYNVLFWLVKHKQGIPSLIDSKTKTYVLKTFLPRGSETGSKYGNEFENSENKDTVTIEESIFYNLNMYDEIIDL